MIQKKIYRYKRTTVKSSCCRMRTATPLHQKKDVSVRYPEYVRLWGVSREDYDCEEGFAHKTAYFWGLFVSLHLLYREGSWDDRTILQYLVRFAHIARCLKQTKKLKNKVFTIAPYHLRLFRSRETNFKKCCFIYQPFVVICKFFIIVGSNVLAENMLHTQLHCFN